VTLETKVRLKLAAVVVLTATCVWFVARRAGRFWQSGEQGAQVWFYDQSERELYRAANHTLPPDHGIGGKAADGVRAVVVAFRGDTADPRTRRIAYLETYTPELKALLEQVQAAHRAGKPFAGRVPSRDSDYFQTNTLVKSADEGDWHFLSSAEGRELTTAWRTWRGPAGQPPMVCAP
jgi:hypothetical protein